MNKTKRIDPPKNAKDVIQRRPKRCHICKKMYAFDKYDEHFQNCYKIEKNKIDDGRNKLNLYNNSRVAKSLVQSMPKREVKQNLLGYDNNKESRFRIKNVSSIAPTTKPRAMTINKDIPGQKVEIQKRQKRLAQTEIKVQIQKRQIDQQHHIYQEPNISTNPINITNREILQNPENYQEMNSIYSNSPRDRIEENMLEEPRPTLIQEQYQPQQVRSIYNIEDLMANSNSIIDFIRSVNMFSQDQTMDAMLNQLQQLNMIAEQISQINSIGSIYTQSQYRECLCGADTLAPNNDHQSNRDSPYKRIQLTSRYLIPRIDVTHLVFRQNRPQLITGFSQSEMEQIFPEKINFVQKQCSICLEDIKKSEIILQLQCFHIFHPGCVKQWLKSSKKCPMCRKVQVEKP